MTAANHSNSGLHIPHISHTFSINKHFKHVVPPPLLSLPVNKHAASLPSHPSANRRQPNSSVRVFNMGQIHDEEEKITQSRGSGGCTGDQRRAEEDRYGSRVHLQYLSAYTIGSLPHLRRTFVLLSVVRYGSS